MHLWEKIKNWFLKEEKKLVEQIKEIIEQEKQNIKADITKIEQEVVAKIKTPRKSKSRKK